MTDKAIGHIGWVDLTIEEAPAVRDFYQEVIGWSSQGLSMGDYDDFTMVASDGKALAGICHAKGPNVGLPAAWLIYINVADLDESMARCRDLGGEVLAGPKEIGGYGRYCVIQDPAGACCALFEHAPTK